MPIIRPIYIFIIAAFIRLYACLNTAIINPDGLLYIFQAKAFYLGQWDQIFNCGILYLSNYPILIASMYMLCNDWIIAAKMVSLLFGWATLFPLYYLLKRFVAQQIAMLCLLIYALMPVLVSRSADIVKGPVSWFFLVWGLVLFLKYLETNNHRYVFASLFVLCLSTWARIEGILYIGIFLSIFIWQKYLKNIHRKKLICICGIIVALICLSTLFKSPLEYIYRGDYIIAKFSRPIESYQTLRHELSKDISSGFHLLKDNFLIHARRNIWLVGVGVLINQILEAFFYPFILFAIIGFPSFIKGLKKDNRLLTMGIIILLGIIILYIHLFQFWELEYRYFAFIMFPAAVIFARGIEKTYLFIQLRSGLTSTIVVLVLGIYICVFGLGKNFYPRGNDKLLYKDIGSYLSASNPLNDKISIASHHFCASVRTIFFYANLNYQGLICPNNILNISQYNCATYDQLIATLRNNAIQYFIYEEKRWPQNSFNFIKDVNPESLRLITTNYHPDSGRLLVFQVQ